MQFWSVIQSVRNTTSNFKKCSCIHKRQRDRCPCIQSIKQYTRTVKTFGVQNAYFHLLLMLALDRGERELHTLTSSRQWQNISQILLQLYRTIL
jgi:hypothetical protein